MLRWVYFSTKKAHKKIIFCVWLTIVCVIVQPCHAIQQGTNRRISMEYLKNDVVEREFDDNFAPLTDDELDSLNWDFDVVAA